MTAKSNLPSTEDFAILEGALFDRITVRYRRQVRRHRLVAAAAVLIIAGASVAAGTVANPQQQSNLAYCYQGATTNSRVAELLLPNQFHPGSHPSVAATNARVTTALLICESAWSGGAFNSSTGAQHEPVPKLQVCLRDDLIVSVFRKTNTGESAAAFCENLGQSAP